MAESIRLDEDWQSTMSLGTALWKMYENQMNCDVIFVIGTESERIGAHSTVLMARSRMFFSQFSDGLPESEIHIGEVQPEEFVCFLRYLYTEEARFENISQEKVMLLAERYEVKQLIKLLLECRLHDMKPEEFCPFVNAYQSHMSDIVKFKCLEYVFKQPYAVFQSATFQQLPHAFLVELLKHERLVMQEDNICTTVLLWAAKQCEKVCKKVTGANQREVLGQALYLIRFPLLSQDFFTENVSDKGLLNEHEELQICRYYLEKKKKPDQFNTEKRIAPTTPFVFIPAKNLMLQCGLHTCESRPILSPVQRSDLKYVHRFTERGPAWGYQLGAKDAISFTTDKKIDLTHVYIYGPDRKNCDLNVVLKVTDSYGSELSSSELTVNCNPKNDSGLYEVGVENDVGSYGVCLFLGNKYHIVLEITNHPTITTYYGRNGLEDCDHDGVHFEFFDSHFSTNKTDIHKGQIAGFKFTVLEN